VTGNQLDRTTAEHLAAVVAALRDDWDERGIVAALAKARDRGDVWQVSMAAIRAAADPSNRTPAVIAMDGPHWQERTPGPTPKDPSYATVSFEEACVTCGRSEYWCTSANACDHQFQARRDAIRARVRAEQRDADFTPSEGSYYPPHRRHEIEAELREGLRRAESRQEQLEAMRRPVDAQTGEEVTE
jgi:hypothetical protein